MRRWIVSIVVPNLQDDMHDGTIQQGDTFSRCILHRSSSVVGEVPVIVPFQEDIKEFEKIVRDVIGILFRQRCGVVALPFTEGAIYERLAAAFGHRRLDFSPQRCA